MAQRNRHDRPGQRHHIYNRGLAKRVMFPDRHAKRRFLSLIACAVRRGEIVVESFSVLDTHYHLMARSTDAPIGYPMMRIQNGYSRYLNRRLKRDGPLPRGRFGSSPVEGRRYTTTLIRYIDFNAVKAGLCSDPALYAFGSARLYATKAQGPAWLDRTVVHQIIYGGSEAGPGAAARYRRAFGSQLTEGEAEVIRRRMRGRPHHDDELDRLVDMPSAHIAEWMRRKAQLADGLQPWPPTVGSAAVLEAIQALEPELGSVRIRLRRLRKPVLPILTVGLLHDAAGLGCEEIARKVGAAGSTVGRRLQAHRRLLVDERDYAMWAGGLMDAALRRTYPRG